MKKFSIGMVISAVDKVTGPVGRMTSSVRKAAASMSNAMEKAGKTMGGGKKGGHGSIFGDVLKANLLTSAIESAGHAMLDYGMKSMDAADESDVAFQRLKTLMMNVKGTTLAQVNATAKLAEQMQNKTVIEDDALITGQSQLATYQLNYATIKKLTPALADLAAGQWGVNASGEQLTQSANLIGKVYTGQIGALRRAGISFNKVQEHILKNGTAAQKTAMIVKVLKENYGGLAESLTKTGKGAKAQMAHVMQNTQEALGSALIPIRTKIAQVLTKLFTSDAVQKGIANLADGIQRGLAWFDSMSGTIKGTLIPAVREFVDPIVKAFQNAATPKLFDSIIDGAKAIMDFIRPVIKVVRDIVTAVIGYIAALIPPIMRIFKTLSPIIKALAAVIGWLWNTILEPLLGWLIKTVVPFIVDVLCGAIDLLVKAIVWIGTTCADIWTKYIWPFFQNIGTWFANVWNGAKEVFKGVIDWIVDKWDKFVSFILKAWDKVKNAVAFVLRGFGINLNVNAKSAKPSGAPLPSGSQSNSTTTNKSEVTVKFENAPKGTRVKSNGLQRGVNLKMGYNNVAG